MNIEKWKENIRIQLKSIIKKSSYNEVSVFLFNLFVSSFIGLIPLCNYQQARMNNNISSDEDVHYHCF